MNQNIDQNEVNKFAAIASVTGSMTPEIDNNSLKSKLY